METEITTSPEELKQLVKDGHFFTFCVAFAINKGFKSAIKEKTDFVFSVGDYNVKFEADKMCFVLNHKEYFARMIIAHYQFVEFIGDDENEVINELMTELEKELK